MEKQRDFYVLLYSCFCLFVCLLACYFLFCFLGFLGDHCRGEWGLGGLGGEKNWGAYCEIPKESSKKLLKKWKNFVYTYIPNCMYYMFFKGKWLIVCFLVDFSDILSFYPSPSFCFTYLLSHSPRSTPLFPPSSAFAFLPKEPPSPISMTRFLHPASPLSIASQPSYPDNGPILLFWFL